MSRPLFSLRTACGLAVVALPLVSHAAPPPELRRHLAAPQVWVRDTPGPIVSLGAPGQFDDTHIFAPAVALASKTCQLWYCGSTGDVARRVFRLIMGKLVFDTMRGIDFLLQRDDVDPRRIGVAGNSLGGAVAGWMAAVEPRIRATIVSGWAFDDVALRSKYCTKLPNQRMREWLTWSEYLALAAPHCTLLIMNGDADWVIDTDDDGSAWAGTRAAVRRATAIYRRLGAAGSVAAWFEPQGGHRRYFAYKEALAWVHEQLGTPAMTAAQIRSLPTVNSGAWCDRHGIQLERLYGTLLHQRGATLPDLSLRPIPREKLACLKSGELGAPEFTVEGWLRQIERQ